MFLPILPIPDLAVAVLFRKLKSCSRHVQEETKPAILLQNKQAILSAISYIPH